MDWLHGISITCFAASYLVALVLEVSRVFFRAALRKYLVIGILTAGLFAHAVFLMLQAGLEIGQSGLWTGSLAGWSLGAAWCLASACLWVVIRQPRSIGGLFLLPLVLGLIAMGTWSQSGGSFAGPQAKSVWSMVHGLSLLLGTSVVAIGFMFGVMYLLQSWQLKKKIRPPEWFRLPSLEWLQLASERSLIASAALLGLGLASGLAINLINNRLAGDSGSTVVAWNDPVVWTSGVLFVWLFVAMVFNLFYKPARQGRKVAYLVVASFLFLVLVLVVVFQAGHAMTKQTETVSGLRPTQNSFSVSLPNEDCEREVQS